MESLSFVASGKDQGGIYMDEQDDQDLTALKQHWSIRRFSYDDQNGTIDCHLNIGLRPLNRQKPALITVICG